MNNLIEKIQELSGKAQFVSFTYTTKEKLNKKNEVVSGGEVSRYTCILGANYLTLLEKSLISCQLMDNKDFLSILSEEKCPFTPVKENIKLLQEACADVIISLKTSIAAHKAGEQHPSYTKAGQYESIGNGLNINSNDNTLQLFVLVNSKVVLKKGIFKQINSAPETIAKDLIRKSLPIGKFREFALDLGNVHSARLDGETLVLDPQPEIKLEKRQLGANKEQSGELSESEKQDLVKIVKILRNNTK